MAPRKGGARKAPPAENNNAPRIIATKGGLTTAQLTNETLFAMEDNLRVSKAQGRDFMDSMVAVIERTINEGKPVNIGGLVKLVLVITLAVSGWSTRHSVTRITQGEKEVPTEGQSQGDDPETRQGLTADCAEDGAVSRQVSAFRDQHQAEQIRKLARLISAETDVAVIELGLAPLARSFRLSGFPHTRKRCTRQSPRTFITGLRTTRAWATSSYWITVKSPDLHVHSTFSMLDGMGTPLAVVERAKALGWEAVALTEHGHMMSAPVLYRAAKEIGIKPIIGCEFYIVSNEILGEKSKETRGESYHLTVLALSAEGYHNLVAWTTFAAQPQNFYYNPRISLDAMAEIAPYPLHHNVVLSGCLGSELSQEIIGPSRSLNPELFVAYIDSMKSLFTNFYIEVQNHRHGKFMDRGYENYEQMVKSEELARTRLLTLARQTSTPVVLTNDSHFQSVNQRSAHLLMTASKRGGGRKREIDYHRSTGTSRTTCSRWRPLRSHRWPPIDTLVNASEIAKESSIVLHPLDKDTFSYSIPDSGTRTRS
jgi:histidinol phosphatase-like PHP family hydrolase